MTTPKREELGEKNIHTTEQLPIEGFRKAGLP